MHLYFFLSNTYAFSEVWKSDSNSIIFGRSLPIKNSILYLEKQTKKPRNVDVYHDI